MNAFQRMQLSPYQEFVSNTLSQCKERGDLVKCVERAKTKLGADKFERYVATARDLWKTWKPNLCSRCHGNPMRFSPAYDHVNAGECLRCNGSGNEERPAPNPVGGREVAMVAMIGGLITAPRVVPMIVPTYQQGRDPVGLRQTAIQEELAGQASIGDHVDDYDAADYAAHGEVPGMEDYYAPR